MNDLKIHARTKFFAFTVGLTTLLTSVLAHSSEDSETTRMMWGDGGGWMHNAGHMTGYNMWGTGWFGFLFGIAIWILVILGIIYLYQKVTEK